MIPKAFAQPYRHTTPKYAYKSCSSIRDFERELLNLVSATPKYSSISYTDMTNTFVYAGRALLVVEYPNGNTIESVSATFSKLQD